MIDRSPASSRSKSSSSILQSRAKRLAQGDDVRFVDRLISLPSLRMALQKDGCAKCRQELHHPGLHIRKTVYTRSKTPMKTSGRINEPKSRPQNGAARPTGLGWSAPTCLRVGRFTSDKAALPERRRRLSADPTHRNSPSPSRRASPPVLPPCSTRTSPPSPAGAPVSPGHPA
jgi:hypothetical protein